MEAQEDSQSGGTLMAEGVRKHYGRPPILEAVIDIQAELPVGTDLGILGKIQTDEESRYPTREELIRGSITLEVGPTVSSSVSHQPLGYRLFSPQRDRVAQIRLNGLSCSKLYPYDTWEANRDETKRLWTSYVELARPMTITRLAIRYITRIKLPDSAEDLTKYFRVRPEIPNDMPHAVSGFLLRLEIPQPDLQETTLVLGQGTVLDPDTGETALLLDLDLFQQVRMPVEGDDVWHALERLHARENLLFERCITDRTRTLFA